MEYCHRNGFTSEGISGSNSTAQNSGGCVLLPSPPPFCLGMHLYKTPFFVIKCCCGYRGGSPDSCLHISIWCSGLKTNMQTSYLHISMVTLNRKYRTGFLKLTCFFSPLLAENRGKVLKPFKFGCLFFQLLQLKMLRWGD